MSAITKHEWRRRCIAHLRAHGDEYLREYKVARRSDCGAVHDRDVNAAKNILARGLASLAEGALA